MKRSIMIFAVIIGCMSIALCIREWALQPDQRTHLWFFDVGQGDSALIRSPGGRTVLIDGGPDWSTLEAIGKTLPFFHQHIDALVLSHANLDHLASFPEILKRYRVKQLFVSISTIDAPWFKKIIDEAEKADTAVRVIRAGDTISLDTELWMDILWPPQNINPSLQKELNNTSLVLRVHDPHHSALYTGDIEGIVEEVLLKANAPLRSEILKVAHHGSKTSSTDAFVKAVGPKTAIISVGKENPYGHPHINTRTKLQNLGADIRTTSTHGTIEIIW